MKKRHFKTLAMMAVAVCMGLTSCKQLYYQVYDVNSDGLKQEVVKTEDIHPPKTGISVHFCVLSLMAMQK